MIILGKPKLVLKDRAQFRPRFIIPNGIVERQSRRVKLVDRNVDMHIVRIVVDDAYPLMFGVAELLAKTLLDHPQRLSIGIFPGPERHEQMIGPIRFGARVQPLCRGDFADRPRRVGRDAIGDRDLPHPRLLALRI